MDRKVAKSDPGIVATSLRDGSWCVLSSGSKALSGVWSIVMYGGHGVEVMEVRIWMSWTTFLLVLEEFSLLHVQVVCYYECVELYLGVVALLVTIAWQLSAPSLHTCGSNRHVWVDPTRCLGCLPPQSATA